MLRSIQPGRLFPHLLPSAGCHGRLSAMRVQGGGGARREKSWHGRLAHDSLRPSGHDLRRPPTAGMRKCVVRGAMRRGDACVALLAPAPLFVGETLPPGAGLPIPSRLLRAAIMPRRETPTAQPRAHLPGLGAGLRPARVSRPARIVGTVREPPCVFMAGLCGGVRPRPEGQNQHGQEARAAGKPRLRKASTYIGSRREPIWGLAFFYY